ncbi:NADH-FMN oxidoreductase RutF, flavin reductase (DIM6/NTAB) family [Persephonella hydrogeniphila]|uniref:NADH-FMN oxidoreductase RutF, flavin reductase (DIM6/NTAB) family n=1 Tax=Persephonella hydrogeniphila TaxID=198703 RepID=A0A285NBC3_9AQUI|nr:flavin reductase family protein [Persephonella hydrogeniphila]SNZ06729.1 NADH-FMN oxidoreductase RutF, flavin reductase (DIM6/NTAB) family [Persephonella hydrogeniphila]
MEINVKKLEPKQIYKLMTSIIVPRPIAWISTVSKKGVYNLAPFSYFGGISSEPPLIMVSIGSKSPGEKKDTWKNIEETGEFVINMVTKEVLAEMNITALPFEEEVDEFEKAGLTPVPSTVVKPPRVKESPVSVECRRYEIIEIGKMGVVLGEILNVHVRDDILNEKGYVDTTKLEIVGRLGGANYCLITADNTFELKRPDKE